MKRKTIKTCKQCGYTWENRADYPKKCPKCQSWHWNEESK